MLRANATAPEKPAGQAQGGLLPRRALDPSAATAAGWIGDSPGVRCALGTARLVEMAKQRMLHALVLSPSSTAHSKTAEGV